MTNALANLKPGDEINGFTVVAELNRGAMANSYAASDRAGTKVFFKQYKSPSALVPWYRSYVAYQDELKKRITGPGLRNFCYRPVAFFQARKDGRACGHDESHRRYFQVFEFVSGGKDLRQIIWEMTERPGTHPWPRRLVWAKVIMASVAALHAQRVVHADLKPENLILIPDESIGAKYRLKLIDMDYSVLTDVKAPWHDHQGYAGTPGYFSPEHLRDGGVPGPASDVFTCALILGELLCGAQLIGDSDARPYVERALAGEFERRPLADRIVDVSGKPTGNDDAFLDKLYAALNPDPAKRPTAADLNAALNAAPARSPVAAAPRPLVRADRPVPVLPPVPVPLPVPVPPSPASAAPALRWNSADSKWIQFNIATAVMQGTVRRLGDEARFWDSREQCRVERRADGWYLLPNAAATNQTLVNGKACTAPTLLREGDEVAVGNVAKNVKKLPLKVSIG